MTLIPILFTALAMAASCHAGDREIIAATILGEARGEGKAGMYAVACVIQVRANERRMTPAQVCTQRLQFSACNGGVPLHLLKLPQATYALELADAIGRLDASCVGHANHYHTDAVSPSWSKGRKPVAIVGGHKFFRL